jgi:hypothetical protein
MPLLLMFVPSEFPLLTIQSMRQNWITTMKPYAATDTHGCLLFIMRQQLQKHHNMYYLLSVDAEVRVYVKQPGRILGCIHFGYVAKKGYLVQALCLD